MNSAACWRGVFALDRHRRLYGWRSFVPQVWITLAQHRKATEHVECRKDTGVIDESPAAYKSIEAVMAAQSDLVEVVHTLRQVVCVKG